MLRFVCALILGKIIYAIGKPFGKATNLPGAIALKLCPELFGHFHFKGKVLAVTGSNGKTSTANLIAHILSENGYHVINNAKGSNLTGGIATTLLSNASLKGEVAADYVVLECDERYSRLIFKRFAPDYLLVTNLFRDQLTRNGNVDVIIGCLNEAIKPKTALVLNGNDPISSLLAPNNPRVYYAMDKTPDSSEAPLSITHDAKACPKCFGKMRYDYFHYNHIGKFECTHCGYKTPKAKYLASDVDLKQGLMKVNGEAVQVEYKTLFNFLNTTAAIALLSECGLGLKEACAKASTFKPLRQRFEELTINGRNAVMILSKNQNPVSYDQSISYLLSCEGEKTMVAYINNINHTNNKDTTWLYDIAFERLKGHVSSIVCAGPRGYDLAVRLKLAGFEESTVHIATDNSEVARTIADTTGTLFILTELYDAQTIISALGKEI